MADPVQAIGDAEPRLVWTFVIEGSAACELALPGNPTLRHPGKGRTIWKMIGSSHTVQAAETLLQSIGMLVQRYGETETSEQRAERLALLGRT